LDLLSEGEDGYDDALAEWERLTGVYSDKEQEVSDAQDRLDGLNRAQELDDAAIAGARYV